MSEDNTTALEAVAALEDGTRALRVLLEGGLPAEDGAVKNAVINLSHDYAGVVAAVLPGKRAGS